MLKRKRRKCIEIARSTSQNMISNIGKHVSFNHKQYQLVSLTRISQICWPMFFLNFFLLQHVDVQSKPGNMLELLANMLSGLRLPLITFD